MDAAGTIVGRGVFATVHLELSATKKQRAVKVYEHAGNGEAQQMHNLHLKSEIRLAGRLTHAHIIAPHEVRIGALRTELVMEYAPHGTLEAYTHRLGPMGMPEAEGRRLFEGLRAAVAYLHGQGFAHRDVKLDNVMLDASWQARLIDFGSAQDVKTFNSLTSERSAPWGSTSAKAPTVERILLMQGTPGYMGPEALQAALSGRGGFDLCAADVWSLGICFYCLFNHTGLPFRGKNAEELLRNVVAKEPPELVHLSKNGSALMRSLLSKEASSRPTAAAAASHAWLTAATPPASPSKKVLAARQAGGEDAAAPFAMAGAQAALARPQSAATPKYSPRTAASAIGAPGTRYAAPSAAKMAVTAAHGREAHEDATRANVQAARVSAFQYRNALPAPPQYAGTRAAAAVDAARERDAVKHLGPTRNLYPSPAGPLAVQPLTAARAGTARPATASVPPPGMGQSRFAPADPATGRGPMGFRVQEGNGMLAGAAKRAAGGVHAGMGAARSGPNADLPPEFCASLSVRSFASFGITS